MAQAPEPYTTFLNPHSQTFIANLAISDAKHDNLVKADDDVKRYLNNGLPTAAEKFLDEDSVFKSLFNHDGNNIELTPDPMKYLKNLNSKIDLPNSKSINCTIGIPAGKRYNYEVFNFPVAKNFFLLGKRVFIKGDKSPLIDDTTFASFIKGQAPEAEAINLIVDFNQSGFLDVVRKDSKNSTYPEGEPKINYLMTPEVKNDPAGKTNLSDNLFKKTLTNFVPLLDVTPAGSNYINFKPNDSNTLSTNFFSNYSILLNRLKLQENFKSTKITGHGQISLASDARDGNSVYNFTSDDGSNSNANTLSRIKSIFKRLNRTSQVVDIFSYNAQIQHKRSGDWLQALACGLLDGRIFQNTLTGEDLITIGNNVTYFVTHDRNAASYALSMGMNVMFLTVGLDSGVIVFNNKNNLVFKQANPDDIIASQIGNMQTFLINNYYGSQGQGRSGLTFAAQAQQTRIIEWHNDNYNPSRANIISDYIGNSGVINTAYAAIITELNETDENISSNFDSYMKGLSDKLAQYFQLLVEYVFIQTEFIDVSNELRILNEGIANNIPALSKQINAFNKVVEVYYLFKNGQLSNSTTAAYKNIMIAYMKKNLYKLNVYLSVSTSFTLWKSSSRNLSFTKLFTGNDLAPEDKTDDVSSFIAYLKDLDDTYKVNIVNIAVRLEEKVDLLKGKVAELRTNKQAPYLDFINIINVLTESVKILTTDTDKKPVISEELLQSDEFNGTTSTIINNNNMVIKNLQDETIDNIVDNSSDEKDIGTAFDTIVKIPIQSSDAMVNKRDDERTPDDIVDGSNTKPIAVEPNNYFTRYLKRTTSPREQRGFFRRASFLTGGNIPGGLTGRDVTTPMNAGGGKIFLDIFQTRIYWPLLYYDTYHSYVNISSLTRLLLPGAITDSINYYWTGTKEKLDYYLNTAWMENYDGNIDTELFETLQMITPIAKLINKVPDIVIDPAATATAATATAIVASYYRETISEGATSAVVNIMGFVNRLGILGGASIGGGERDRFIFKKEYGCHPLLPLYNILSSYWYNISYTMVTSPDFSYFQQYYIFLNKCYTVLNDNYLKSGETLKIVKAYYISKCLTTLLFNISTNIQLSDLFEKMITSIDSSISKEEGEIDGSIESEITEEMDISCFTMINGIFSSYFCGTVKLPEIENEYALGFINNELFKNFIMNEVNFKEIFGIYDESLMIDVENPEIVEQTVKDMQNNVYKDMEEITKIIVNDEKNSLESENTIEEVPSKAAMSAPLLYRRPLSMANRMGNPTPRRGVYTVGGKRKTRKRSNKRKHKKTNKKKSKSRKNKTKKGKNQCNNKKRSKNRK